MTKFRAVARLGMSGGGWTEPKKNNLTSLTFSRPFGFDYTLARPRVRHTLLKCIAMEHYSRFAVMHSCRISMAVLMLCAAPHLLDAQAPAVPDWAQPGSPTHVQVPPPADFHRPSTNFDTPIGVFQGQSDIGSAVVPGSASYDPATKRYTITSAGYNILVLAR